MDGEEEKAAPAPGVEPEGIAAPAPKGPRRGARTWLGSLLLLVVVTATLIFTVENPNRVPVHLFGAAIWLPLGVAILFGVVAGALIMFVIGSILLIRQGRRRG